MNLHTQIVSIRTTIAAEKSVDAELAKQIDWYVIDSYFLSLSDEVDLQFSELQVAVIEQLEFFIYWVDHEI